MPAMTKNSGVSQAVVWTGCLISYLGLHFDRSGLLFALGGALFSIGMIQSYFGTVLEIQASKRLPYLLLGVPLTLAIFYAAFLGLRELSPGYLTVPVIASAIGLQAIVSLLAARLWSCRDTSAGPSANGNTAPERR